jgi:amylosucrase
MDWELAAQRHDAQSVRGRIFVGIRQLIAARAATPVLHGANYTQPMWSHHPHVFALARQSVQGTLLLLANFAAQPQQVSAALIGYAGLRGLARNVLSAEQAVLQVVDSQIMLEPYETMWLVDAD